MSLKNLIKYVLYNFLEFLNEIFDQVRIFF